MILIILLMLSYPLIPPVPGSLCTPDDPDFLEYRYPEKIAYCRRNVATWRKREICWRDGVYDRSDYTADHIIPLSVGGSNHDDNLWCQHKSLNVTRLEYNTYLRLKRGWITQVEAIKVIIKAKFKLK